MATRPLLAPIDPSSSSLPARSPSPSSSSTSSGSGDDSAPATPSKDKMREWTFPRTGVVHAAGGGGGAASSGRETRNNDIDGVHGRSSSVAPSSAGGYQSKGGGGDRMQSPSSAKGDKGGVGSIDLLRHRSNASLAFAPASSSPPSTTLSLPRILSSSSPAAPNPNLAKLIYSNVRRRSAHDLVFILIFGGAFVIFARALVGAGYDDVAVARSGGGTVDVEIPQGFLPPQGPHEDEYLAEVHARHGDSSHDQGDDHFRDSPPEDEQPHDLGANTPDSDEGDPLYVYPPSPAEALGDDAAEQQEERPARLVDHEDAVSRETEHYEEADEDEEAEEETLAISREEAERADPDALDEDAEVEAVIDEEEEVSENPSLEEAPRALDTGNADEGEDDEDDDEPGELTALEELLDSASLEAEEGRPSLLEMPLEPEEKRVLERAGRGRQALRRGKGAQKGKGGARARMEKRVRR